MGGQNESIQDIDVEGRFLLGIEIWVDGGVDAEITFALRGKAAVIANREPAGRERAKRAATLAREAHVLGHTSEVRCLSTFGQAEVSEARLKEITFGQQRDHGRRFAPLALRASRLGKCSASPRGPR